MEIIKIQWKFIAFMIVHGPQAAPTSLRASVRTAQWLNTYPDMSTVSSEDTRPTRDRPAGPWRPPGSPSRWNLLKHLIYLWISRLKQNKTIWSAQSSHVRVNSKLVRALEHFVIKKDYLSWRLCDRSQSVIDGRNELSTKNTTTLKKGFPKSIKNSSRNPLQKFTFRCICEKTTKFINKHQNPSNLLQDFLYKISRFVKNITFLSDVKCPTSRMDYETKFLSILENCFSKWLYFC